ncbi:MAG: aldehyde dehydrogenase (NADP(+)) [Blastocatellia bacterium]|nr:aldehyde dehydrogenase (NADP(+)) [Blastocatellia bacterium]
MSLAGFSLIGSRHGAPGGTLFFAINPATGEQLDPPFHSAHLFEVDEAAQLAARAFATYSRMSGRQRARFLRQIAENIEALGDMLLDRVEQETALPRTRLQAERARTCFQLRLFADLVEEGSWVDARIDRADPYRQPIPKPDVRSMMHPLGPVAVFGASNFPLAFSVAGGDTASALAAGNPVIVKAHPAHPGTSELVGRTILEAARACAMPEGVFSLLFDAGIEIGRALVKHPSVKAVAFTGSRAAGLALMMEAASRPDPIPFYAEMSSINPIFILPGALRERGEQIAIGLHASVTLGAGQFCTKPGIVVIEEGSTSSSFVEKLATLMAEASTFTLLTPGICATYRRTIEERARHTVITLIAPRPDVPLGLESKGCHVRAALFQTDARSYLVHPDLSQEIFGPATLLVTYSHREQLLDIARQMEGQLTASIHGTEEDLLAFRDLIAILETKVGRLIFNGFPTGVEVCHAMVHGGPFPATSDGRSTSVGTRAIYRFTRPVCYQNFPNTALPDELKDENPLGIWRLVDGQWTREPVRSTSG